MITNKREQKICEKYSARDNMGYVHCNECPLSKGNPNRYDFRCKATCHYDRKKKEWVLDDSEMAESEDIDADNRS